MCGIVGFINNNNKKKKKKIILNMMNMIKHRGPDSSGKYIDHNIALGFRRLSIIDEKNGNQPIFNENKTKLILFNGEIYNYKKLKYNLIKKGHIFKTNTDTEVILHGYEEYNTKILNYINGMFAFVIWDKKKKILFGAKDFFGIKPLYYYKINNNFIFGSEIKSFLKHPNFKKIFNKNALKPFLIFQYSALEETFFKNVYRLPEGHFFIYKNNKLIIKKYWDNFFYENKKENSTKKIIKKINNILINSIKQHIPKKIKFGTFLSSGIDSSYVTAISKTKYSFSINSIENFLNETKEAKKLSNILKIKNISTTFSKEETLKFFPKIQYHLDEPDANPSCIPLFFLSKLAKKYVKVILSGEGADEIFAGYNAYGFNTKSKTLRFLTDLLKKLPFKIKLFISNILNKLPNFKGKKHLYNSLTPAKNFFIGQEKIFNENEINKYLNNNFKNNKKIINLITNKFYKKINKKNISEVKKMQYLDMHQWLTKDILLKADKLSMANSIEIRVPFLNKNVLNSCKGIQTKFLINYKNTKYIFRKAANYFLPKQWINRKKLGFPVPIKIWLLDKKFYNKIKKTFSKKFVNIFFNQKQILKLLKENFLQKNNNRRKIWTIYTFLIWYEVFFIKN